MIKDFLEEYYEAHGRDVVYEAVQSSVVDGHEVSWMKYTGTVLVGEHKGEPFYGHALKCECDFKRGVGWDYDKVHGVTSLHDAHANCNARKHVMHRRYVDLKKEFQEKYSSEDLQMSLSDIIIDLIAKNKANELLEEGEGAICYGGHFYVQTLSKITGIHITHIWKEVHRMVQMKLISLEGSIVQDYRESPPPEWEKEFEIDCANGWFGVASAPTHSKMPHVWYLEVTKEYNGEIYQNAGTLPILNPVDFGIDISDSEQADAELERLAQEAEEVLQQEIKKH